MQLLFLRIKIHCMKRKIYTALLFSLIFISAKGQCPFDPTITPSNLILCPNESDTLWTQVYDSYQWYQGSSLIPGATNQYYVVSSVDAGSYFSVAATDSNCTEMSPQVLVDSWVFLLPFVIHEGDQGWFDGQYTHLCHGDTLILILGQPYEVNIQWYNGATPIPGATNDSLLITSGGSYTVEGAPAVCPNFVAQLGLFIDVIFHQPIVPVITFSNDTLYANPGANSYQWYLNASAIPGATNQWYYPTTFGSYTVSVVDTNQCPAVSLPFIVTGVESSSVSDRIRITYNGSFISVHIHACINDELRMYDAMGHSIQKFSGKTPYQINAESFAEGIYLLTLQCGQEFFARKIIVQK
jgi:hypothetical protein